MLWTSVQCLINVQENKKDTSHNGCSNEAYDTAHVPHTLAAPKSYLYVRVPQLATGQYLRYEHCQHPFRDILPLLVQYISIPSIHCMYIACTLHHLTRDYPHSCTGVGNVLHHSTTALVTH